MNYRFWVGITLFAASLLLNGVALAENNSISWFQGSGFPIIPDGEESEADTLDRLDGCARNGTQWCRIGLSELLVASVLSGKPVRYTDREIMYLINSGSCSEDRVVESPGERDGPVLVCREYNHRTTRLMQLVIRNGLLGLKDRSWNSKNCWDDEKGELSMSDPDCLQAQSELQKMFSFGVRPKGFSMNVYFP